jgi:hypothetical protein
MNNRLPDHQLGLVERGQKAGDYLRNAVNVDLTNAGTLQRRRGATLTLAGVDCHSLWSDGADTFYADGADLKRFTGEVVATGLAYGRPVSFCKASTGDVIWTDGVRLEAAGKSAVAVPTPNPAPIVTASTGGALRAGFYQVAITAVAADGRESGSTWPIQVQVPDSGRLEVSGLPGTLVNLYVSPLNGDTLYLTASTTASSYIIPVMGTQGAQCQTLNLRPLPAGRFVREYHGRLLVADGFGLYYSEPWAYGLYNPLRGYIPLAGITLMEPGQTGVYVATADKTYWLSGLDVDQVERMVDLLPYGAVEGSAARMENSNDIAWFSARGLVVGTQDGQVKNTQEETVAVGAAQTGATLYREQDGMRQLVSSGVPGQTSRAAASSYMAMEVVRKENML